MDIGKDVPAFIQKYYPGIEKPGFRFMPIEQLMKHLLDGGYALLQAILSAHAQRLVLEKHGQGAGGGEVYEVFGAVVQKIADRNSQPVILEIELLQNRSLQGYLGSVVGSKNEAHIDQQEHAYDETRKCNIP
jgi:hypothetical protein